MTIKELPNTLDELLYLSSNQLLVIKCGATWCAPCKEIKPFYQYLADNYPNVSFYDLDIDNPHFEHITASLPITKIPTFVFIKNQSIIHSIMYQPKNKNNDKDLIETFISDNL